MEEVNLASATFIWSLPQLLISRFSLSSEVLVSMLNTVADGLLYMSAGQQSDLAFIDTSTVKSVDVEESVTGKSGGELAMFARLASQFAGADPETVDIYTDIGRAMGIAGQLSSDCNDIFHSSYSKDLSRGARTLPVVLHLERLTGDEKEKFLELLKRAKEDHAIQGEVRNRLLKAGELRRCALVVEIYRQKALKSLKKVNPLEPASTGLKILINSLSFFS